MYNVKLNNGIAIVESSEVVISDAQSSLDFIATISHEYGVNKAAINKSAIAEEFFKLSTGIAGETIQKFVNYQFRLAIFGDFSSYTSKSLRDYMYECNKGKELNFVSDIDTAIKKLQDIS